MSLNKQQHQLRNYEKYILQAYPRKHSLEKKCNLHYAWKRSVARVNIAWKKSEKNVTHENNINNLYKTGKLYYSCFPKKNIKSSVLRNYESLLNKDL